MEAPNNLPRGVYWPSEEAQRANRSLRDYARALLKELAAGKTFPRPDPDFRRKMARKDAEDPSWDMKHALAVLESKGQCDADALEREDRQREKGNGLVEIRKGKPSGK